MLFFCDVWGATRQWLTSMRSAFVLLADVNLRIWEPKAWLMKTKDAEDDVVTLTRHQADFDICVWLHVHTFRPPMANVHVGRTKTPRRFGLV